MFAARHTRASCRTRVVRICIICLFTIVPAGCNDDVQLPPDRDGNSAQNPDGFAITTARWHNGDERLEIKGQGARDGGQVTVSDAETGVVLGIAEYLNDKNWVFETAGLDSVPCSVVAAVGGSEARMAVDGAPRDCDKQSGEPELPLQTSHAGLVSTYEGSRTCNECHDEAREVHSSVHYQWLGSTPHVLNMETGGKLGSINDFCGNPDINFTGSLTNINGETIEGGCALCHVGMGDKPASEASQAQLENIDCLVCHSDSYRRKAVENPDGSFTFAPAPEKMDVPLSQAITDIQAQPTKGSCVNCHAYSKGGCSSNKRGDLEDAHRNPPSASFDVHMASQDMGGAGLNCQNCHITEEHRMAGRGVDLRPTDLNVAVRCTNCHTASLHNDSKLNDHSRRIDCATCHIPVFAKITATDMVRDYSRPPLFDTGKRIFTPHVERRNNVVPEYRFWNGLSTFYRVGTPFQHSTSGRVLMAGPQGDITDADAKIFPFKRHLAVLPYDLNTNYLLPLELSSLFRTGDMEAAIVAGAQALGWSLSSGYDFVQTERLMGIFHEVAPANEALRCDECHGNGSRMDFDALGYTPLLERDPGRVSNCAAGCHDDGSSGWSIWDVIGSDHYDDDDDGGGGNGGGGNQSGPFFPDVHNLHVDQQGIECNVCHNY